MRRFATPALAPALLLLALALTIALAVLPRVRQLPLGGTAVGTGLNATPGFAAGVILLAVFVMLFVQTVKTHRAVVVASNMGPSLIIDPFGRELASHSSTDDIQWVNAEVPIVTELSLYARLGEIFILGCGMIVLARVLSFLGMRNSPVAVFSDVTVRQRLGL